MSSTSWQKTCGEGDDYDIESATACHAPLRDLEHAFDAAEDHVSGWLDESMTWLECMSKQGLLKFNNWVGRGDGYEETNKSP